METGIKVLDLVTPIWAKIAFQFLFNSNTKKNLRRDLRIFSRHFSSFLLFPETVLGLTSSFSSIGESLLFLIKWIILLGLGFALIFVSCTPVLCAATEILEKRTSDLIESTTTRGSKDRDLICEETNGIKDSCPEKWFFINGIGGYSKKEIIAQKRAIEHLFGRKVHLIFNPSHGLLIDAFESSVGRAFRNKSLIGQKAYQEVESAITSGRYKKVVIISHSNGSFIASDILDKLSKYVFPNKVVQKLEVYTFGSTSDHMNDCSGLVHCEHFANKKDMFAKMGVLDQEINYQTNHVFTCDREGHLFNNYLNKFETKPYSSKSGPIPKLYSYLL